MGIPLGPRIFWLLVRPWVLAHIQRASHSFDDDDGDGCLNDFNIDNVPPYLLTILKDIKSVDDQLKVQLAPSLCRLILYPTCER